MGYLGVMLGLLAVVAGLTVRARRAAGPTLSADQIAEIERTGRLELEQDEPLDLEEARQEEERFWQEESWDEAEEL